MSIATKALVVDLYAVQCAVPSKNKTQTKNKNNQAKKTRTTTTKPKQTNKRTQRSGIAASYENSMHDDILCVIMSMATEKEAKLRKHRTKFYIFCGRRPLPKRTTERTLSAP